MREGEKKEGQEMGLEEGEEPKGAQDKEAKRGPRDCRAKMAVLYRKEAEKWEARGLERFRIQGWGKKRSQDSGADTWDAGSILFARLIGTSASSPEFLPDATPTRRKGECGLLKTVTQRLRGIRSFNKHSCAKYVTHTHARY